MELSDAHWQLRDVERRAGRLYVDCEWGPYTLAKARGNDRPSSLRSTAPEIEQNHLRGPLEVTESRAAEQVRSGQVELACAMRTRGITSRPMPTGLTEGTLSMTKG